MDTKQRLGEKVHEEVMACIGCHDCMLACPLPESAIVNIAELNDAVQHDTIVARNVTTFVQACTQCQMCVPACPADLSRADMVLFNKMKIEDATLDRPVMMQAGEQVHPSGLSLDGLTAELSGLRLFEGVPTTDLRRLALACTLRLIEGGGLLQRRGQFHERLVIVLSGLLEQTVTSERGERVRLLSLSSGSFFGELAVMADQPELYDVRAVERSLVVEVPKAAALRLAEHSPVFQQTMAGLYQQRALATHAEHLFARLSLPAAARSQLRDAAKLRMLAAGESLLTAEMRPEHIYLVRNGFLRAIGPTGVTTVYFREGDWMGVLSAVDGESQYGYGVTASCRSEVIELPAATLIGVLSKSREARAALARGPLEAERVARTGQGEAAAPAKSGAVETLVRPLVWEELVEGGVAQSTQALVIDQTRCTHCRSCVDACGRRHGHSRLELEGLQLGHLLFPTACRHCDDPVCLLCSVNGIVRRSTGEIAIVEESCVGCGACASRCPYGNIRMHAVEPPKRGFLGGIWAMLGFGGGGATVDDPKAVRVATKCDLCIDHDDYACVTACPVGAAARVDPMTLLGGHGST